MYELGNGQKDNNFLAGLDSKQEENKSTAGKGSLFNNKGKSDLKRNQFNNREEKHKSAMKKLLGQDYISPDEQFQTAKQKLMDLLDGKELKG